MSRLFLHLINQSLTTSALIAAVILLRFLFRKLPKSPQCLLWAVVALRLAFPFSLESAWSLIPRADPIPSEILVSAPAAQAPVTVSPAAEADLAAIDTASPAPEAPAIDGWEIASVVWLIGCGCFAGGGLISYWHLKKKLRVSLRLKENIYLCDSIAGPFVLGLVRPKIYFPFRLDEFSRGYVLAHEQAHLRHKDPWWKLVGYALLCVYWFQPMVWVAWWLFCQDLEMACDERAVRDMTAIQRKTYACVLLECAAPKEYRFPCPVAFSQNSVKERIRNVLTRKKSTLWILGGAAVLAIAVCSLFLTTREMEPKQKAANLTLPDGYFLFSDNNYEAMLIQADTSKQVGGIQGTLLNETSSGSARSALSVLGIDTGSADLLGDDTEWSARDANGAIRLHSPVVLTDRVYDIWLAEDFTLQEPDTAAAIREALLDYVRQDNSFDLTERPLGERISARSAAVYDLTAGKTIYAKNYGGEVWPGKWSRVAFAAALLEQNPGLDTVLPVPSEVDPSFSQDAYISYDPREYQDFTLQNHLYNFLMNPNSYVSAWVLTHSLTTNEAEALDLANRWLQDAGCSNTYFDSVVACVSPDAHTTTEDIVRILKKALENDTFRSIWETDTYQLPGQDTPLYSTNLLLPGNPVRPDFADSRVTGGLGYVTNFALQSETSTDCFADLAVTAGRKGRYLCIVQNADRLFQENGWTVEYWGNMEEMRLVLDTVLEGEGLK